MYPTKVVDRDTLYSCLDRMYKNYVDFCISRNGAEHVMPKEFWIESLIKDDILEEVVCAFNERELDIMSN